MSAFPNAPAATTILEAAGPPFAARFVHAVEDMRRGHPVILIDNSDRENEADLIVAAERLSIPAMAMLIRECSGIVCLCLMVQTCDRLRLPPMASNNENRFEVPFTPHRCDSQVDVGPSTE